MHDIYNTLIRMSKSTLNLLAVPWHAAFHRLLSPCLRFAGENDEVEQWRPNCRGLSSAYSWTSARYGPWFPKHDSFWGEVPPFMDAKWCKTIQILGLAVFRMRESGESQVLTRPMGSSQLPCHDKQSSSKLRKSQRPLIYWAVTATVHRSFYRVIAGYSWF